jgi:tetratricopeptide (TPR) repeat protein
MGSAAERCRLRDCEQAISLAEAAAQLEPANTAIHYYLGICYSGGCRQHSLVDLQVAHIHLGNALSRLGPEADPLQKANILAALANTYAASRHMPLKARLMAAIECHEQAAGIFQAEGQLDAWAREEFNLGNAFSELPKGTAPNQWQEAIRHYECGLLIRTRENDPDTYAGTLQNLGIAYREVESGNRAASIKHSLLCYRRALQVRRSRSHPRGYAALHINAANSFMSLAKLEKRGSARHRLRALRHYDRALAVCATEHLSDEYAMVQFNRGEALICLARESSNAEAYLREARSCLNEAAHQFQRLNHGELAAKSRYWLDAIDGYLHSLKAKPAAEPSSPPSDEPNRRPSGQRHAATDHRDL